MVLYQAAAGASGCAACPVRTSCAGSAPAPLSCPAGTFAAAAGCASCASYLPGAYQAATGATGCMSCAAGRNSAAQALACTACSAGRFQSGGGAPLCSARPAGYSRATSGLAGVAAFACPAGQYSSSGAAQCSACGAGQFQASPAQSACAAGSVGKFQASTGAASCAVCPAGSSCGAGNFQANAGEAGCMACPAGQFQPNIASVSCQACPSGFFSTTATAAPFTCVLRRLRRRHRGADDGRGGLANLRALRCGPGQRGHLRRCVRAVPAGRLCCDPRSADLRNLRCGKIRKRRKRQGDGLHELRRGQAKCGGRRELLELRGGYVRGQHRRGRQLQLLPRQVLGCGRRGLHELRCGPLPAEWRSSES